MKKLKLNLKEIEADVEISDGYYSFDELYEHRITLYIALCKQLLIRNRACEELGEEKITIWRSSRHADGSIYEGWFILGINKEIGDQITYHIPNEKWSETHFAETLNSAPEWDGHTSNDVLERIKRL